MDKINRQADLEPNRRQFLKNVGGIMAAAAALGAAAPLQKAVAAADSLQDAAEPQHGRYPWWVKEVEQITTEQDWSLWQPIRVEDTFGYDGRNVDKYLGAGTSARLEQEARRNYANLIKDEVAGESLPDLALVNAARSVYWWNLNADGDFYGDLPLKKCRPYSNMYWDCQSQQGIEPWLATPEEATAKLRQAARFFGFPQIGISPFDEEMQKMMYSGTADKLNPTVQYKHVITMIMPESAEGQKCHGTALGDASNRYARALGGHAAWAVYSFVNQLGYQMERAQIPEIYAALRAGLGELGRSNRLISPLYGGAIHLFSYLTDLPLVNDNPIDFGLQEFCKRCKKCCEVCPSQAISYETEPTWECLDQEHLYQQPGKKTYYEDSLKCVVYLKTIEQMCSICLSSCPWSKQNKTALHDIIKVVSSQMPALSAKIKFADDTFGYENYWVAGDQQAIKDWWDIPLPLFGLDSNLNIKNYK